MPPACVIAFDNPSRVYYAGQTLCGTVNLTLFEEETVRSVYVRIFGRAYAHWREYCSVDHNRYQNRERNQVGSGGHHISYTGEKVHLDMKYYIVGDSNSSKIFLHKTIVFIKLFGIKSSLEFIAKLDEIRLPSGQHTYSFQCLLPAELPTSIEHSVGHITYSASVVLNIPVNMCFSQNFNFFMFYLALFLLFNRWH